MALSYSLMSESQIATFPPPILPTQPTLNNYANVLDTIPIGRYLLNSFIVSTAVVIGQLDHRQPRGVRVLVPGVPRSADRCSSCSSAR